MSPVKVMPLLLALVTVTVMMPGVARTAESQIILAQAQTPQQQEEERKKREHAQEQQKLQQQRGQDQQKLQQQKAQDQQKLQQKQAQDQQLRLQEQQKLQQKQAQEQQLKGQEQQKLQQQKAQDGQRALQQKQAQEQQLKLQEQQKLQQQKGQDQKVLDQQRAQDAARLRNDQAKIQQLQQQQQRTGQQLQQSHQQQGVLRRDLTAEDQKAKAERDAHRLDRERLIAKQQQTAGAERSQAAVAERLRLQNERLRSISSQRQQSVDAKGQTIIREPGNRTIIQVNNRSFIQHNETDNFRLYGGNAQTVKRPDGGSISTIVRPGGFKLQVEVDAAGRPLRRVRIFPDGRRFVLFENRPLALGVGLGLGALVIALAPPRVEIPREQYIVDASYATEDDIYGALQAPPVEPLDRGYSLDEVLASVDLRERMRSISIDTINFEFGSWELGPDQAQMLESVAAVMRDITNQNPGEVFLIEGHTDAVGSELDNLSLSDRRSQAVSEVLSTQFGIPAENLVTQGYGKQFLLIPTDEPERRNRRVVIRRITPLLGGDSDRVSSRDGDGDQYRR